jgi:hypothetical protein
MSRKYFVQLDVAIALSNALLSNLLCHHRFPGSNICLFCTKKYVPGSSGGPSHVHNERGVLGNKCAGQHNLKTVYLERHLLQVMFWHGHQQYVCFFAALYLP